MDGCDGGAAGDVLTLCVDQRGAGEQLLAQEAERRSHRRLFQVRSALRSVCGTFRSSASDSRRTGNCRVPASPAMPGWLQVYNNKAACSCPIPGGPSRLGPRRQ